jgi:hypothetical protein
MIFHSPAQSKQHFYDSFPYTELSDNKYDSYPKRVPEHPTGLSTEYPDTLIRPIQCNGWIRWQICVETRITE